MYHFPVCPICHQDMPYSTCTHCCGKEKNKPICKDCQFQEGHSPICQTEQALIQRKVTELLSAVMGGKYGTKNRAELILKLQDIKMSL